ncbi:MAG: glycosyltransferase [Pseudomonadota bacterium]
MSTAVANSISLSIVSHGHAELLRRLLQDLAELPSLSGAKVVVTLNIPERFDAAAFPALNIELLRNATPKGFGANHNAAFQRCTTPWFVVLNPDLRIQEDPFPALLERAHARRGLALLGPTILNPAGGQEDSVRDNLTPISLLFRRALGRRRAAQVTGPAHRGKRFYWLAGMFLMLRSSAFAEVGGFDERFFMYCEDYDLCARLYIAGHLLELHPDVRVIHDARRDSHRSGRHLRWHLRSVARVWTSPACWRIALSLV